MPHRSAAQMYRAARKSDALLTGAPLPTLFYFALPIILGNIFQQLYSIVDAIVVGKFLGDLPLAGISVAAPIVDVANALVIGGTIGIGGGLVLSAFVAFLAFVLDDTGPEAKHTLTVSILIFTIVNLILVVVIGKEKYDIIAKCIFAFLAVGSLITTKSEAKRS